MKRHVLWPCLVIAALCLQTPAQAQQGKTEIDLGNMQVEVLVDSSKEASTDLLNNTTPAMLEKYIPSGTFPLPANSFIIRGTGVDTTPRIVLVDTGFGFTLLEQLATRGIKPEEVEAILLTHMHFDHIGGLLKEGKATFPKATLYVSHKEQEYWADNANLAAMPAEKREAMARGFTTAQNVLAEYKDRLQLFTPTSLGQKGEALISGVHAIAAYGHTPGHTVFQLEGANGPLLLMGDAFHARVIQFPEPSVTLVFDVDQAAAAKTRQELFQYVDKAQMPFSGAHIPAPQFGKFAGQGYKFSPLQ